MRIGGFAYNAITSLPFFTSYQTEDISVVEKIKDTKKALCTIFTRFGQNNFIFYFITTGKKHEISSVCTYISYAEGLETGRTEKYNRRYLLK